MSRGIICQSRSPPSGNGTMRTFRSFNPFSVFYVLFVSQKSVGILAFGGTAQNGSEAVAKHMDPVSEIRQRRREEDDTETVPKRSLTKRLEKLDFYPKIGDDYVIKTESGGYGMILLRIVLMCSFRDLFHSHDHPLHFRARFLCVGP